MGAGAEAGSRARSVSPVRATAVVVFLYLGGAVVVYWSVWSGRPSVDSPVGPDAALNTWFLAWAPHALAHGLNPFFTTTVNAPYGVNVLNNTSELLLGILAAPITVIWGPIASFNVLMTMALAGSATSAYFLARRLTSWRPAAFAAGLLFGFSPYMIAESAGTHLHLTFLVVPPLIFLVLHELLVVQRWPVSRCGLALAGLVVAQFFISVEVLVTTAVTALVAVVVAAVVGRHSLRPRLPYAGRSLAVALGVSAAVLAYPIWFLTLGPGHINGTLQLVPEAYRADLFGPFIPDLNQWLAPAAATRVADHFANSYSENGSYLGIPLVVTLGAGVLWLRRRAEVWVLALSGLAVFVLSLGGALAVYHAPALNGSGGALGRVPLPEAILAKLPILDSLVPVRFSGYVVLFAALLLAVILDALHTRVPTARPAALATAAAVACFLPLVPSVPLGGIEPAVVPPYFSSQAVTALAPRSVTVVLPFASEPFYEAQLWQVTGSHPYRFDLAGGYFLVAQPGRDDHIAESASLDYTLDTLTARVFIGLARGQAPHETAALKAGLTAQFRAWKVANVVVALDATPEPAAAVAFLTWLLGPPTSADVRGAAVWYGVSHLTQPA